MPGTVIRVHVARRLDGQGRRAARRARGDEDGDAADRAVRRRRAAVHVREGDRVAGGAVLVELELARSRCRPRGRLREHLAGALRARPASGRTSTGSCARTARRRRSSCSCTGSDRTRESNSSRGRRTSAGEGYDVVYPRYESPPPDANARNNIVGAVGAALGTLGRPNVPLVLVGHSRGGRLAVEAAAFLKPAPRDRVLPGPDQPAVRAGDELQADPEDDEHLSPRRRPRHERRQLRGARARPATPQLRLPRDRGSTAASSSRAPGFTADHMSVYSLTRRRPERAIWEPHRPADRSGARSCARRASGASWPRPCRP